MEIQQQIQGAVTVLRPIGPLADKDAEQFKVRALQLAGKTLGRVVVDASAIPFIDSPGIEALVDVTDSMSRSGQALKLCGASAVLMQVLSLTGWSDAFEFFDDVNGAVRSFL